MRIGAVGCWVGAALFWLFGAGRETLAAVALLFDVGTLCVGALFLRELLGRERAALGLPLLAVAPPGVVFWTYMPVSYGEQLFAGALTLWLAAGVVRRGAAPLRVAALGAAAGLAFWTSPLTLCLVGPALLWVAARRGRELLRASLPAVAGFLLGSLPWWIYNLAHDFLSVRAGYVPGTAARDAGALDHLVYTLAVRLPELLASTRSLRIFLGDGVARAAIGAAIMAIYLVLALLALVEWRRGRAAPAERPAGGAGDAAGLAAGIVGLTLLANSLAGAGAARGLTERYVLPVFLALPLVTVIARGAPALRGRVAGLLVGLLVVFDLATGLCPWHPSRQRARRAAKAEPELIDRLRGAGVEAMGGSYDQVYSFNFLSGESIFGLPIERTWDVFDVARRLPARPLRWVLLGRGPAERATLLECAPELLPQGRLEPLGTNRWLWIGASWPSAVRPRRPSSSACGRVAAGSGAPTRHRETPAERRNSLAARMLAARPELRIGARIAPRSLRHQATPRRSSRAPMTLLPILESSRGVAREKLDDVVIRFAGDSGDGMQIDRQPVHQHLGAPRQRPRDVPRLPGRDPRARRHAAGRLGLPGAHRRLRHPHAGRRARRAGGDEPGGAQGQPRGPASRTASLIVNTDEFGERNLKKAGYADESARGRLARRLPRLPGRRSRR